MPDPVATQNFVLTQLQNRPISAASLISALMAVVGLAGGVAGSALTGTAGSNALPSSGNSAICLAAGESVTLPAGVTANTIVNVSDCTQGATGGQPLASPEIVNASSDATIAGAPTYQITLVSQGIAFRKTLAGPWQPF